MRGAANLMINIITDTEAVKYGYESADSFIESFKSEHISKLSKFIGVNRSTVVSVQGYSKTLAMTWDTNKITEMPGVVDMALDLSKAVIKVICMGVKMSGDTLAEERKLICKGCPLLSPNDVCRSCGCNMTAKWYLKYFACPLNKW